MKPCFYKVRRICPIRKCYIEYGDNGKCPEDLGYKEDEIVNATLSKIENILKTEEQKIK